MSDIPVVAVSPNVTTAGSVDKNAKADATRTDVQKMPPDTERAAVTIAAAVTPAVVAAAVEAPKVAADVSSAQSTDTINTDKKLDYLFKQIDADKYDYFKLTDDVNALLDHLKGQGSLSDQ